MVVIWTEMLVSRLYTYVKLSKLYTFNMCSLLNIRRKKMKRKQPVAPPGRQRARHGEKSAAPVLLPTLPLLPSHLMP